MKLLYRVIFFTGDPIDPDQRNIEVHAPSETRTVDHAR
jgi:hypothetical protein